MIFLSFFFSNSSTIDATAEGHASEVIETFRQACQLILGSRGAWRFTMIEGSCTEDKEFDSDMTWNLRAELKSR